MARRPSIYTEIEEATSKLTSDLGFVFPKGEMRSVYKLQESKFAQQAEIRLQPWLAISELAAQHFLFLSLMLDSAIGSRPTLLPIWSFTSYMCTQLTAIRKLCCIGLNAQATVILRTMIESARSGISMLGDKDLRARYVSAQTEPESREFWNRYLRDKSVTERIKKLWQSFGIEDETADALQDWLRVTANAATQPVHSAYLASVMAFRPPNFRKDIFQPGFLGALTPLSLDTLGHASQTAFVFTTSLFRAIDEQNDERIPNFIITSERELRQGFVVSHMILQKMVLKYWLKSASAE